MNKTRVTIRAVISAMTAAIVLVVAVTAFAITYSQGLNTAEAMGLRYCEVLGASGRIRIEETFAHPVSIQLALAKFSQAPGVMLPADSPEPFAMLGRLAEKLLTLPAVLGDAVPVVGMFFQDGSRVDVIQEVDATTGRLVIHSTVTVAGRGQVATRYDALTMTPTYNSTPRVTVSVDGPIYGAAMALTRSGGLWQPPVLTRMAGRLIHTTPAVRSLFNGSGAFMCITPLMVSLEAIQGFLNSLSGTAGTRFFAIDTAMSVVASTVAAPSQTRRETTIVTEAQISTPNCATSWQTSQPTETTFVIICRTLAADFAYAPLRAATSDSDLAAVFESRGDTRTKLIDSDGGRHYVTVARVTNAYRAFPLSLVVTIPEQDVLGDVFRARDIAIGAVVAIFVAACALSFALIAAVLRPLQAVAGNMRRTARLREVSDAEAAADSALREVHELQVAYAGMNAAIRSFTRYVPRDVVKDLLASGQLCAIQMAPARCTVLFSDIAGFTTLCERVPAAELSALVRSYFERMSSLVMRHGGVIDKFIGDCVMAIWGAPVAIGNQELRAALCAARMHRETLVAPLHDEFDAAGEQLAVRVGVATGAVLAGNMGSAERMSYTVIGDDVNLAARLEALNKQFGTRVMLAEATAAGLPSGALALRLLHRIQVKGKDVPVAVYEVLGVAAGALTGDLAAKLKLGDAPPEREYVGDSASETGSVISRRSAIAENHAETMPTTVLLDEALRCDPAPMVAEAAQVKMADLHTRAVGQFASRRFADAIKTLQELERLSSAQGGLDIPGQRLLEQCEECLRDPPGEDFVAAWRATEK